MLLFPFTRKYFRDCVILLWNSCVYILYWYIFSFLCLNLFLSYTLGSNSISEKIKVKVFYWLIQWILYNPTKTLSIFLKKNQVINEKTKTIFIVSWGGLDPLFHHLPYVYLFFFFESTVCLCYILFYSIHYKYTYTYIINISNFN